VVLRLPVVPRFDGEGGLPPITLPGGCDAQRAIGHILVAPILRRNDRVSPRERSFFPRSAAVLSEGDALLRARRRGLLSDPRREDPDEIARVTSFLRTQEERGQGERCGGRGRGNRPRYVSVEFRSTGIRAVVEEVEPVR